MTTPTHTLGCQHPHPKQAELRDLLFRRPFDPGADGHRRIFAEAGRGGGKTLIAALLMLESATTFNRGLPHLWSEPTYRDCIRVFMRTWSYLVPRDLWTFNKSDMVVTLSPRIGGATIDLFSRHSRDSESEPRGPTYAGAVSDEVAKDNSGKIFKLVAPLLRDPGAELLWHLSITTPRPGWYAQLLANSNDAKIRWSSYDNTYIPPAVFDGFSVDMTEDERRQEIFAEHVSLAGLVWSEFADAPHPAGNRHPHKFDPRAPWTLACDIGNRSAWLVIQTVAGLDSPIDVIVAEYQPDHGDTTAMVERISHDYGYPAHVIAGSDASDAHRSTLTGSAHAVLFRAAWPGARISWPTGANVSKERQVWHAKARVCHPRSRARLLCVSDHLKSHDRSKRRGVLEMFASDSWPEAGETGGAALLRKDKARNPQSVEDTRDALLYAMVCLHPPRGGDPDWHRVA